MATQYTMASPKFNAILSTSLLVRSGPPAVHQLRTRTNKVGTLTRVTFGEKNVNRPNKSILLVGETGGGKPALINALVNYSMGVNFEDGVWFQIVDEEEESSESESQRSDVVIYQIFGFEGQNLPFSLTIIDTPGYGDIRGTQHDDKVSQKLFELLRSSNGVPELHAVGLVMKATDDLISDRLKYIFNSVVSLFGTENTVALITNSDGMPPNKVLKALEKANIECSKDINNESVYFVFNNQQKTQRTQKNLFGLKTAWNVSMTGIAAFARFLTTTNPNYLTRMFEVLAERARLVACIQNLQERIRFTELKMRDVRMIQEALKKHIEERKTEQLVVTVTEAFKDTELIRTRSSGSVCEAAVCCPVCEENCHHPGCTMGLSPQQCEVMKNGNCTSCSNKCPASYHVKDNLKYVIRTRKVQINEGVLALKYDHNQVAGENRSSLMGNLEKQMNQLSAEKFKLLDEAYQHVVRLDQIRSVAVTSASTHVLLDFLIQKLKDRGDQTKLKKLEEMDNNMEDRTRAALKDKMKSITSDHEEMISDSFPVHPGPPAVYQLRTKKEMIRTLTRVTVGQKDAKKPNKTILLVGETGAGKSTLINVLINYSLGVKFEDEVWFQITEEQRRSQTESQTSDVIVYQLFEGQTLPFSLTIIDTPGFGNNRSPLLDVNVRRRLVELFQSNEGVHELHAVGLVMKATDNRLSNHLMYVFDSVMSLFGKNMEKNILALITHSDMTTAENVLQTLEAANTKCAKDEKNRPVHFLLDSKQTLEREPAERAAALKYSWDFSFRQMDHLTRYLTRSKPQTLEATLEVLNNRIQLTACIQNLKQRIQLMEVKKAEIRQNKEVLKNHEADMRRNENFTVQVDEIYKQQLDIAGGGMWGGVFYNGAVSCSICQVNCHYPCTMAWSANFCQVMNAHALCTVCGCHASAHCKKEWRYEPRTRKVQKILEDVKKRYETSKAEWMKQTSLLNSLENESRKLSAEKSQLTDEAYYHVVRLEQIALGNVSLTHLDFLIGQINDKWKVQKLEEMRRRMDGDQRQTRRKYISSAFLVSRKKL